MKTWKLIAAGVLAALLLVQPALAQDEMAGPEPFGDDADIDPADMSPRDVEGHSLGNLIIAALDRLSAEDLKIKPWRAYLE